MTDYARLARELKPFILPWLSGVNASSASSGGAAGGAGGGGVAAHALSGPLHTGVLAQSQAPWAVPYAVFNQHAANPDAHHLRSHALDSALDHTGTLSWVKVNKTGASLADLPTRLYADLQSRSHNIVGADHTVIGSTYQLVGLTATNTLGLRTPSADVSAGASEILRSESGALGLASLTSIGNLTLSPTLALILNPANKLVQVAAGVNLRTQNYASQVTGWAVDYSGAGDFRYLYTDELHAKAFIADLEQALAGLQVITKSVAVLAYDFTAPAVAGSTQLYVRDLPSAPGMQVFQANDWVRLRAFSRTNGALTITDCWGIVSAPAVNTGPSGAEQGVQRWTFVRGGAGQSGAMSPGFVVRADALVLDYGTSGNGVWETNAIDGQHAVNSPYAQALVWTGNPVTGQNVRVRVGNLRGAYGYGATVFGLGAGALGGAAFTVEDVNGICVLHNTTRRLQLTPGGDLILRNGLNVETIRLESGGDSYFAGRMTIATAGEIVQGSGTFGAVGTWPTSPALWGTFTGLRIGNAGGIGRIGGFLNGLEQWSADSNGRLRAVNATLSGSITATTGKIAEFTISGNNLVAAESAYIQIASNARVAHGLEGFSVALAENTSYYSALAIYNANWSTRIANLIPMRGAGNNAGWMLEGTLGLDVAGPLSTGGSLAVSGVATFLSAVTIAGSLSGPTSISTSGYGSFNDGNVVIQWGAAPYYGLGIRASTTGGWARSYGFFTGSSDLGGFGAYGAMNALAYWYIGSSYTDRTLTAYPSAHATYPGQVHVLGRLQAPHINATTQFERSGTQGLIYVPITPRDLVDGTGTTWSGGAVERGAANYLFNVRAANNGSQPTGAKAVRIVLSGNWLNVAATRNAIVKRSGVADSQFALLLRSLVNGINTDQQGVVELDGSGQFEVKVFGDQSMRACVCRLVGYYI